MKIVEGNDFKNKINDFRSLMPRELISKKGYMGCGITDDDGTPLGAVIYSLIDQQCHIRWIYVKKDRRREGAASLLVNSVLSSHKNLVSAKMFPEPDYADVYKLFESLEFSFRLKEKLIYSMSLRELLKRDFFKEKSGKSTHPSMKIIRNIGKGEKKGILKKLPGNLEYDEKISSVCIHKGELIGACLMRNSGDEIIYPVYMHMYTDPQKTNPGIMTELFFVAVQQSFSNYGPDTIFSFYCRNESDEALMKRIMGNAGPVEVIEAYLP